VRRRTAVSLGLPGLKVLLVSGGLPGFRVVPDLCRARVPGRTDAGQTDAGRTDAGRTDAGRTDAGQTDAGQTGARAGAGSAHREPQGTKGLRPREGSTASPLRLNRAVPWDRPERRGR